MPRTEATLHKRSRRTIVWNAMGELLQHLRASTGAGTALLLEAGPNGAYRILAADSNQELPFSPNEPVCLRRSLASLARGEALEVISQMCGHTFTLSCDVHIPIPLRRTSAHLILSGSQQPTFCADHMLAEELDYWNAQVEQLRHRDVDQAYRIVAEAASVLDAERLHDVLLACVRRLSESEVAYMAVPVDDTDFAFSYTQGIETRAFKTLRIPAGRGLGGFVRQTNEPITSLNYERDRRFDPSIRATTSQEGIFSALAVPVAEHGTSVDAVIYAGNREPVAYTPLDEQLLSEFSPAVRLANQALDAEHHRRQHILQEELGQIAQTLHDTLGRQLTQMTFLASELAPHILPGQRQQFEQLAESITESSALLREHISKLGDRAEPEEDSLQSIADRILDIPAMGRLHREVSFSPSQLAEQTVPGDIAQAMITAGQEAVFNAESHSNGRSCHVHFQQHENELTVRVRDDGTNSDLKVIPGNDHMGLRQIETTVHYVGGTTSFSTDAFGTSVFLSFPSTNPWQNSADG